MTTEHDRRGIGWLWKIPLIAVADFVATMISGSLITAMGMEFPEFPEMAYSPVRSLLAALVLGAALYLLARGIRGSSVFRWFVLFAFTYISYCVNNQIESAIFTRWAASTRCSSFSSFPARWWPAQRRSWSNLPTKLGF